jgi:hypothetical protein
MSSSRLPLVRGRAGEGGAEDRADRHRGDDQALGEAAEVEVGLDEEQRPGDDAGVVAEKQPAEARDRGGEDDVSPRSPRGFLGPDAHPAAEPTLYSGLCGNVGV